MREAISTLIALCRFSIFCRIRRKPFAVCGEKFHFFFGIGYFRDQLGLERRMRFS